LTGVLRKKKYRELLSVEIGCVLHKRHEGHRFIPQIDANNNSKKQTEESAVVQTTTAAAVRSAGEARVLQNISIEPSSEMSFDHAVDRLAAQRTHLIDSLRTLFTASDMRARHSQHALLLVCADDAQTVVLRLLLPLRCRVLTGPVLTLFTKLTTQGLATPVLKTLPLQGYNGEQRVFMRPETILGKDFVAVVFADENDGPNADGNPQSVTWVYDRKKKGTGN